MAFNRNKNLTKAQKLLQKGKVGEAITELQEVVNNDPSDVRTLLRIGDLHAKAGNIESACESYRQVGESYAKDGFFLKAVAVFKQILKLDPGLIRVYLRLAELYQQLGLNSEAMKQYQVVVRHYENQGLKKESLDVLRKMAELDPENTASRVKLAELYIKEGHNEAAQEQFRGLATELAKKSNHQDLARVYEKMETLNLADESLKIDLSELYLKTGEPKRALSKLNDLFKSDPKNVQVLEMLARTFMELQQGDKAKSIYTELVHILSERGMTVERDRILAKLKGLGVSVAADEAPEDLAINEDVEFDVSVPEVSKPEFKLPASSPAPKSPASAAASLGGTASGEEAKVLQESEVFLKYGLVDKACQLLGQYSISQPKNDNIRAKLIEAYQQKGDTDALIGVLTRVAMAADKQKLSAVATKVRAEIEALNPSENAVEEVPEVVAAPAPIVSAPKVEAEFSIDLEVVDDSPPEPLTVAEPEVDVIQEPMVQEVPLAEVLAEPEFERQDDTTALPDLSSELEAEEPVFAESLPEAAPEVPVESLEAEMLATEIPSATLDLDSALENEPLLGAPESEPEPEPMSVEPERTTYEPIETPVMESVEPEPIETVDLVGSTSDVQDSWSAEMDEVNFFVDQGLLDEAREVLQGILTQDPGYGPAKAKLDELDMARPRPPAKRSDGSEERRATARPSKPMPPVIEEPAPVEKAPAVASTARVQREDEGLFDLSSELQDEIHDLESELSGSKDKKEEDDEYLSPEEVISEFKKGVSRTVAKNDFQTHYNLGIAYKEMGLLNEAIQAFEVAAQDSKMGSDCASMIGLCLVGKKDFSAAIDVYRKALGRTDPKSKEAMGLSYELAEAYLGNGSLADAYKLFARIRDVDPAFRDVRRRAKELEADLGESAPHPSAPEKPAKEDPSKVQIPGRKNKISYI